jgi:hypothetical protein
MESLVRMALSWEWLSVEAIIEIMMGEIVSAWYLIL